MTFDFENKRFLNNGKKYEIVFLEDITLQSLGVFRETPEKKAVWFLNVSFVLLWAKWATQAVNL